MVAPQAMRCTYDGTSASHCYLDSDGDGVIDAFDVDSDNDGITDAIEAGDTDLATPPLDTDLDGLANFRSLDSDGDHISDTIEAKTLGAPVDSDNDGTPDYIDSDSDNDGIPDACESVPDGTLAAPNLFLNCTKSKIFVCSGALCADWIAVPSRGYLSLLVTPTDTNNDGTPDYLDADSDGDGIPDAIEARSKPSDPASACAPGCSSVFGCCVTASADHDFDGLPDYRDLDSDNDGLLDKDEDKNGNGSVDCELDALSHPKPDVRFVPACGQSYTFNASCAPLAQDVCATTVGCGWGAAAAGVCGSIVYQFDDNAGCVASGTKCLSNETSRVHPSVADTVPDHVDITWMSVANMLYEFGALNVVTDGYITRIAASNFTGGNSGLKNTINPSLPDVPAVTQVLDAIGGAPKVNLLLTGHSHFDHSFDTATWSMLTGAPIIGSQTTCFQAQAQNIANNFCTPVSGYWDGVTPGETIALSSSVTVRIIRWDHSGDSGNPEQHLPVELIAMPTLYAGPGPGIGGLRAGVAEDFPNGGGGRAFLFTVAGSAGNFSWFFENSSDTEVATDVATKDEAGDTLGDYGAPTANLKAAMADAGLTSVDLWIGTGGSAVFNATVGAQKLKDVLKPKFYLPVHWVGNEYFTDHPFLTSKPVFSSLGDTSLPTTCAAAGVTFLDPNQGQPASKSPYMNKWRLDPSGVSVVPNTTVQTQLFGP